MVSRFESSNTTELAQLVTYEPVEDWRLSQQRRSFALHSSFSIRSVDVLKSHRLSPEYVFRAMPSVVANVEESFGLPWDASRVYVHDFHRLQSLKCCGTISKHWFDQMEPLCELTLPSPICESHNNQQHDNPTDVPCVFNERLCILADSGCIIGKVIAETQIQVDSDQSR